MGQEILYCTFCKSRLIGQYWKVEKILLCSRCYRTLPRCVLCGLPVKEYLQIGTEKLCMRCSAKTDRCAICHIPLIHEYCQFSGEPRKFCKNCAYNRNKCDICSLPLPPVYQRLADKRCICSNCMKTAVAEPGKANKILADVTLYLQKNLKMKIRPTTKLHLVDSQTLAKIRKQYSNKRSPNIDRRALGLFVRQGEKFEVYLETHLPYILCMRVMAHEYTHAWQADQFKNYTGTLYVEGLAEWVSYHVLLHYHHTREAAKIPEQRDEYGQGFAKILDIEKKYGQSKVIAKVMEIVKRQ